MNIQTTQGIIPSGTVSGNQWEIRVSDNNCLSFKRTDWKKAVDVPLTTIRSFVRA